MEDGLPASPLPPGSDHDTIDSSEQAVSEAKELPPTVAAPEDQAGAVIGPYRLLQKIGEGGMGEVWLAEQKSPVRRRVALKLIKAGLKSREVVARFESERQALAMMDHPAIAKIFDAGSTPQGLPYFVMEYVAGLPITDYCDRHQLGVRERLELFIGVCEAVQHAHQKAVIHRDLKPSNVLITEVDGKPMPKVIDFGVAKATAQRLTAETVFTRVGALIGTPEYMSPEQADSGGEDIDTRTDVYSLGVIFYELLVGALPLDLTRVRNVAFHEMLRQLREDEAPRPSTKVRASGDESSLAARNRRTDPMTLGKQLRGDLDSIALKALEKDRSRRYGSPSDFAVDIARYLHDEPVLATASSFPYRARKFVKRHWLPVTAAGTVLLAVCAVAVLMTIQSARIARERDRANREAEAAKRVSDFLVGLFEVSDPEQSRGSTVTAREILEKGVHQIDSSLAGQPAVQARMMATMGRVYEGLGLFPAATELLKKAIQTQNRVLGPNNPETLSSQQLLARLEQYQGHYPEAQKLFESTLTAQRRVLGAASTDTIGTETLLGGLYYQQGRYPDAERLLSQTLQVSRSKLGDGNRQTLQILHNLAMTYDGQNLISKEEATWRELVEANGRTFGRDHPRTIAVLQNLAYTLFRQGKYAEAEKLQREALAVGERVQGKDHPEVLLARGNLANTLSKLNQHAEAEKLQREVLEARRKLLGPESPDTFFTMNNLAGVLAAQKKYAEAEELYFKALEGEKRVLGENHPELIGLWYDLGALEANLGRRDKALEYLGASVKHGYADAGELAGDESFAKYRGDPEYQRLLASVRQRANAGKK